MDKIQLLTALIFETIFSLVWQENKIFDIVIMPVSLSKKLHFLHLFSWNNVLANDMACNLWVVGRQYKKNQTIFDNIFILHLGFWCIISRIMYLCWETFFYNTSNLYPSLFSLEHKSAINIKCFNVLNVQILFKEEEFSSKF